MEKKKPRPVAGIEKAAVKHIVRLRIEYPRSVPHFTPGICCPPVTFSPGTPSCRYTGHQNEYKKEK